MLIYTLRINTISTTYTNCTQHIRVHRHRITTKTQYTTYTKLYTISHTHSPYKHGIQHIQIIYNLIAYALRINTACTTQYTNCIHTCIQIYTMITNIVYTTCSICLQYLHIHTSYKHHVVQHTQTVYIFGTTLSIHKIQYTTHIHTLYTICAHSLSVVNTTYTKQQYTNCMQHLHIHASYKHCVRNMFKL